MIKRSGDAMVLAFLALLVACSPLPAATPTPTTSVDPARASVAAFVLALRTLDRDTEAWGKDFDAYVQRAPSMQQTSMLSEFDRMSARYDVLVDRLKAIEPPAEPTAQATYAKWVTAFAKTQQLVRALREVAATRQGDEAKVQAMDDESMTAGTEASDAMRDLITRFQLNPEEITPPPQGSK
ncbi:MAG: hypothetical protein HY684_04935 [Chloroflexi bacterium]|nr:hypothetical protein [Chloroflexota bacterium]